MKSVILVNCLLLAAISIGYFTYQSTTTEFGFLENNKVNYTKKHNNFDNDHKKYTLNGKHYQNHHIEMGQYPNQYQESAFQYLSAMFNKMDEIHHKYEIERHGKDPFLEHDSKLYYNISKNQKLSGVEHYKEKYEVSLQQATQVLFKSDAIHSNPECIDKNYYTQNGNDAQCSSNCDCTGTLLCIEQKCQGKSSQSQNFQQAQQVYQTNMLNNYFLNLIQKSEMHANVFHFLNDNYQDNVQFDYMSAVETAETLYHAAYILQQIVINPKEFSGDANTYQTFNPEAFKWIAKQVKVSLVENLVKFKDFNIVNTILESLNHRVQGVVSDIQDPSNLQEWISYLDGNISIPTMNIDFKFPEITKQYNDFNNQQSFTLDNYGSYQTFYQVFNTLENGINFDGGKLDSQGQVQMFQIAEVTVQFMFASLLNIFIFN